MNLKEFARILGLSPTTVSRALSGYPEVNEKTRAIVKAAAAKHGYRPNRRAAALATGRAMTIGHVIPTSRGNEMVNPIFSDFIAGAGEIYAAAGYDMLLSVVADGDEVASYRQMIETGVVDGIIVHAPRTDDARIDLLREIEIPFVVHGRAPVARTDYDFVDIDNTRAFRRATDLLLDLGHRRIGLINGAAYMDFARRRRDGVIAALQARDLTLDPDLFSSGEMSEQAAHAAVARMRTLSDPPTAVLVSSLIMAIGVRRALNEAGLEIPGDVSVVIHDDVLSYLGNGSETPLFTATRSPVGAAGRRCAEILIDRIERPGGEPVQEIWECDLVSGTSTAPPPDRRP